MLHANVMALCFLELESWATEVYSTGIGIFDFFAPETLTLPQ